MELNRKQEEGLKLAVKRYRDGEKYTVISGYAGTGKSTLVRFIIGALDIDEDLVAYATYTGKAAQVLKLKGNKNAMTLHKLLYDSVPRKDGGFYHKIKSNIDYDIVVVDEVSMVPKSMIDLLMRYKIHIIFLGDPFQLGQIDKDEVHELLEHPHIFLDEVMRQAKESEIIRLTMSIRDMKPLELYEGTEVKVVPHYDETSEESTFLFNGMCKWADQVITATNSRKNELNKMIRTIYGKSGLPQEGDKIICNKNSWDDISEDSEAVLVNGLTGFITKPYESFISTPRFAKIKNNRIETINGGFRADFGSCFNNLRMDKRQFVKGEYSLSGRDTYVLGKLKEKYGDLIPKDFSYGYAITVHRAQGSEYNNVLVVLQEWPKIKIDRARWLYTAATRASEKLVIMREN